LDNLSSETHGFGNSHLKKAHMRSAELGLWLAEECHLGPTNQLIAIQLCEDPQFIQVQPFSSVLIDFPFP
jgi:hypothetical protein